MHVHGQYGSYSVDFLFLGEPRDNSFIRRLEGHNWNTHSVDPNAEVQFKAMSVYLGDDSHYFVIHSSNEMFIPIPSELLAIHISAVVIPLDLMFTNYKQIVFKQMVF